MLDGERRGHLAAKKEMVTFIAPDEGNPFRLAGELCTAKGVGIDTGWAYTLVGANTQPKGQSLRTIHYRGDTTFDALKGEMEFGRGQPQRGECRIFPLRGQGYLAYLQERRDRASNTPRNDHAGGI